VEIQLVDEGGLELMEKAEWVEHPLMEGDWWHVLERVVGSSLPRLHS